MWEIYGGLGIGDRMMLHTACSEKTAMRQGRWKNLCQSVHISLKYLQLYLNYHILLLRKASSSVDCFSYVAACQTWHPLIDDEESRFSLWRVASDVDTTQVLYCCC